ncbi:MAG: hypothetical protein WCD87_23735, partial [Pseudolabrys sp.]
PSHRPPVFFALGPEAECPLLELSGHFNHATGMSTNDPKRTFTLAPVGNQFTKHLYDFWRIARAIDCDRLDAPTTLGGGEGVR